MAKRLYLVRALHTSSEILVGGWNTERLEFAGMADGCAGVMLAFTNKRKAHQYARLCPNDHGITIFETD